MIPYTTVCSISITAQQQREHANGTHRHKARIGKKEIQQRALELNLNCNERQRSQWYKSEQHDYEDNKNILHTCKLQPRPSVSLHETDPRFGIGVPSAPTDLSWRITESIKNHPGTHCANSCSGIFTLCPLQFLEHFTIYQIPRYQNCDSVGGST